MENFREITTIKGIEEAVSNKVMYGEKPENGIEVTLEFKDDTKTVILNFLEKNKKLDALGFNVSVLGKRFKIWEGSRQV